MDEEFEPSEEQILETRAMCGDPDASSWLWLRRFAQEKLVISHQRMMEAATAMVRPKIDRSKAIRFPTQDYPVPGFTVPVEFWEHFSRVSKIRQDPDLMGGFIPYSD